MKPTPSPDCCYCGKPHGRALRWIFESCDACDSKRDKDASAGLVTASCPRCDLLFSVDAPPTLTDSEREAVERVSVAYELLPTEGAKQVAATLRGLLDRLK